MLGPEKILNKMRDPSSIDQAFNTPWLAGPAEFTSHYLNGKEKAYAVQDGFMSVLSGMAVGIHSASTAWSFRAMACGERPSWLLSF